MFAPGSKAVPWTCHHCQLRSATRASRIAQHAPSKVVRSRSLSSTIQAREDGQITTHERDSDVRIKRNKGFRFIRPLELDRKLAPEGRMLRVGGRRQLQTTEKLSIDSLDKPSQVIVLRDIEDRLLPGNHSPSEDSAGQPKLQLYSTENDAEPSQAEVDESINALRPPSVVLSSSDYSRFAKQIAKSYTREQLTSYLNSALKPSTTRHGSSDITSKEAMEIPATSKRSQWRPHRTPIEQRHSKVTKTVRKKVQIAKSTPKLAKQVLDLAWGATIETDKRQIGELEIELEPWQIRFLFDVVSVDGRPMYQEAVGSSLLMRQAEISLFRPDNIVRVTGTADIARDVAMMLESKLADVRTLKVDMHSFMPLLGSQGWPTKMHDVFDARDLNDVGRQTQCLIQWTEKNVLSIHGLTDAALQSARRLMFSFLDLQAVRRRETSTSEVLAVQSDKTKVWPAPDILISSIHASHRRKDLVRLTPSKTRTNMLERSGDSTDAQASMVNGSSIDTLRQNKRSEVAEHIVKALVPAESPYDEGSTTSEHSSLWQHGPRAGTWSVQICRLLQDRMRMQFYEAQKPDDEGQKQEQKRSSSQPLTMPLIVQPQIPNIAELLSCFQARGGSDTQMGEEAVTRESRLRASFVPFPFTKKGLDVFANYPKIQLTYNLGRPGSKGGDLQVDLDGLEASVKERISHILIPEDACDLRFVHKAIAYCSSGYDRLETYKDVQHFTETLVASIRKGGVRGVTGDASIQIPMPLWLLGDSSGGQGENSDKTVEYLLERFEHVQSVDLVPRQTTAKQRANMDGEILDMMDKFPPGAFLRYNEIETDSVGGRWGELSLMIDESTVGEHEAAAKKKECFLRELAETALKIVHLLTRIEDGTLHPIAIRGWKRIKHQPDESRGGSPGVSPSNWRYTTV